MAVRNATRLSWFLRGFGLPIGVLGVVTALIALTKALYNVFASFPLTLTFSKFIAAVYDLVFSRVTLLDVWWRMAPELNPSDLAAGECINFVATLVILVVGGLMFRYGRRLAKRVASAKQQAEEWGWTRELQE